MTKIGFIGLGNMGFALLEGILEAGISQAGSLIVSDIDKNKSQAAAVRYKVNIAGDNGELARPTRHRRASPHRPPLHRGREAQSRRREGGEGCAEGCEARADEPAREGGAGRVPGLDSAPEGGRAMSIGRGRKLAYTPAFHVWLVSEG